MRKDQQVTGNVGLFYCCYRLSRLGWNVMPTSRNARGVDIIAYNHDATRLVSIQVKTLSARAAVPLGASVDRLMGDYWIIVNNVLSEPAAFVMLPSEVRQVSVRNIKEGKESYWLERREYEKDEYREAWERIQG